MNTIKIIFRKGERETDFLTILSGGRSQSTVESERLKGGFPLCILQYIAEDAFGLVGPIKMLASGIDLDSPAGAFARTKAKIICIALHDQLALEEEDVGHFNQVVAKLCRKHGYPGFFSERASFSEAISRLRKLKLLVEKMGPGGTLNMSLDP